MRTGFFLCQKTGVYVYYSGIFFCFFIYFFYSGDSIKPKCLELSWIASLAGVRKVQLKKKQENVDLTCLGGIQSKNMEKGGKLERKSFFPLKRKMRKNTQKEKG